MSSVPDRVMDTIRKLSEMRVDRGCTPAEAALAAAHLQRLLEKHQLSMFDTKTSTYKEEIGEERVSLGLKLIPEWAFALARAVARPHDCEYFAQRHRSGDVGPTGMSLNEDVTITFIGHRSDAQVASYLFSTLKRLLEEMANRDARKLGRKGTHLFQFRKQFLSAAAQEIFNRLWAEKQAIKQAAVESRALVVVKEGAVSDYMKSHHPSLRKTRLAGRTSHDSEATRRGREAGRQVEIRRGLEGGGGVRRLG